VGTKTQKQGQCYYHSLNVQQLKSDTCYGQATPTALFLALAIDRMKPTPQNVGLCLTAG
jgi:hypothetical protein